MSDLFESYDESLDESLDINESDFEGSEDAEFLGSLLGGLGNAVSGTLGGIASGVGNVASGIGGLLSGQSRPPLPRFNVGPGGSGVSTATLNTPAGAATVNLPAAVVRQDEFRVTTDRLQSAINNTTTRINSVSGDVAKLRNDFTVIETDTRNKVSQLRGQVAKAISIERKRRHLAIEKLKKGQKQQQMTGLMMTMMMQSSNNNKFDDHIHKDSNKADTSIPTDTGRSDNSMMMMLPMMMMGQDGGSGSDDNGMMMMVMAMAMAGK